METKFNSTSLRLLYNGRVWFPCKNVARPAKLSENIFFWENIKIDRETECPAITTERDIHLIYIYIYIFVSTSAGMVEDLTAAGRMPPL